MITAATKSSMPKAVITVSEVDLLAAFELVRNQTIWAITIWDQFLKLFVDDECKTATQQFYPAFAGILGRIMYSDVLVRISKLLDPADSTYKGVITNNATLKFLCKHGDENKLPAFKAQLQEIVMDGDKVRKLRNKALAHTDLQTALGNNSISQPNAEKVSSILLKMGKAVQLFHHAYHVSDLIVMPLPGVNFLGCIHNAQWKKLGLERQLEAISKDEIEGVVSAMAPIFIYPSQKTSNWWKQES